MSENSHETLTVDLLSLLKDLYAIAQYYYPVPVDYEPVDEHDTEKWIVGLLYKDVENVIAAAEAAGITEDMSLWSVE